MNEAYMAQIAYQKYLMEVPVTMNELALALEVEEESESFIKSIFQL